MRALTKNFYFDPGLDEQLVGPDIEKLLADNFNKGLTNSSSWQKIKETAQNYKRPNNVYECLIITNDLTRLKSHILKFYWRL